MFVIIITKVIVIILYPFGIFTNDIFTKKIEFKYKPHAQRINSDYSFHSMTSWRGAVAVEKEGHGRHTPQTNIGAQSSKLKKNGRRSECFKCLLDFWWAAGLFCLDITIHTVIFWVNISSANHKKYWTRDMLLFLWRQLKIFLFRIFVFFNTSSFSYFSLLCLSYQVSKLSYLDNKQKC